MRQATPGSRQPSASSILLDVTRGEPFAVRARALLRLVVSPLAGLPRHIPVKSRLYDVGCGTGAFLALVARTREPAALFGSEISEQAAVRARTAVLRADPSAACQIFVSAEPWNGDWLATCNVVSLIDVLHHIPRDRQQTFIGRLADAMAPGAWLLVKDINASHRLGAIANRVHDSIFSRDPGFERSAAVVNTWLEQGGLRIERREEAFRLWYPHFTFLARKR